MSNCIKNNCRLCDSLIISTGVTFDGTNLVVDLPAGTYNNRRKYCIVIAQAIPDATTINAPVVFTIGGDTATLYPFEDKCGSAILASQIRTRTKYSTIVSTSATTGTFIYVGDFKLPSVENNDLESLPVPAAGGGAAV